MRKVRIRSVKIWGGHVVELELTNGRRRRVDLEPFLHGPIFQPLKTDSTLFRTIRVDGELGTLVWDNGADIDPDVLIEGRMPAWTEDEISVKHEVNGSRHLVAREPRKSYRSLKRKKHSKR